MNRDEQIRDLERSIKRVSTALEELQLTVWKIYEENARWKKANAYDPTKPISPGPKPANKC